MKLKRAIITCCAILLGSGSALGQQPPALSPPSHPRIDGPAAPVPSPAPLSLSAAAPNQAAPNAGAALPANHPPLGQMPAGHPQRDSVTDDTTLPPGTILLELRKPTGQPVAGDVVRLVVKHQSVAKGTTITEHESRVDETGTARFEGLQRGSEWVYAAQAVHDGITYRSPEFQLGPTAGRHLRLGVYQATDSIDEASVGAQVFVLVEPKDEHLLVEQLYRFSNLSNKTWRFDSLEVGLPGLFKAFSQTTGNDRIRIEPVMKRGFRMSGFVPPGTSELAVRYQLPYGGSGTAELAVGMVPRASLVRVIAIAAGDIRMRVLGMPEPTLGRGEDGQKLLVTQQLVSPGGDQIEQAHVVLLGLPRPGPGRWYALIASALAVVAGVVAAGLGRRTRASRAGELELIEIAKTTILEEALELERARQAGSVGPNWYASTRQQLVDQLARLLAMQRGHDPKAPSGEAVRSTKHSTKEDDSRPV